MVYSGLLTPHLPAEGDFPSPQYLPTLLLSTTNCFDFIGRVCAFRLLQQFSDGPLVCLQTCLESKRCLAVLLLLRILFILFAARVSVWGYPAWAAGSNTTMIAAYAIAAFLGGTVTVSLIQCAQSMCMKSGGVNMDQ